MQQSNNGNRARQQVVTRAKLLAGMVGFAILMAVRVDVATSWVRVLLAVLAFSLLRVVVVHAIRDRS